MSFEGLPPNEAMWAYNCLDCVYTREVGEESQAIATAMGLTQVDAFQHEVFYAVFEAMERGVRIDEGRRREFDKLLTREIDSREALIKDIAGFPLNVRSPKQMQAFFHQDLQLPIVWKKRPDGRRSPSLDDSAIEVLKRKEPLIRPLARTIAELRSLGVFRSTFIRAPLDEDGRMRCSYNVCGTETFRLASRENVFGGGTNLQNIPKGGEDDDSDLILPNIRLIFVPDEGMEMFDGDLSKADLRIVVRESGCREMQAMLDEGRDPYIESAREYYRDPTISKTDSAGNENPKYRDFKSFSHGTHYLGTPVGLSQRLGLGVRELEKTQKWYFGKYPEIPRWQEDFKKRILATHKVTNAFGFQRIYFGRIDDSTFREAIAWLPQSTIGIYINNIWLALLKHSDTRWLVEMLLQVHDSLVGQYPVEDAEATKRKILEVAAGVSIPYPDPLVIPFALKTSRVSWGDCK